MTAKLMVHFPVGEEVYINCGLSLEAKLQEKRCTNLDARV